MSNTQTVSLSNKFTGTVDMLAPIVKTLYLYPNRDSVIFENEGWATYGSSTLLEVSPSLVNPKVKTIFNFGNLQGINPWILNHMASATLQFNIATYRRKSHSVSLYEYNDADAWVEPFVCWNNAPSEGEFVSTDIISRAQTEFNYDITARFKKHVLEEKMTDVGYCLISNNDPNSTTLDVYSKEFSDKSSRPVIKIKYFANVGSPVVKKLEGSVRWVAEVGTTHYFMADGSSYDDILKIPEYNRDYVVNTVYSNDHYPNISDINMEITGEVEPDTGYKWWWINDCQIYVPKYTVFDVTQGSNTDPSGTEFEEITCVFDEDTLIDNPIASSSSGDLIAGNTTIVKDVGCPWIDGEMEVYKGSVFTFRFFNTLGVITYTGNDVGDIETGLSGNNSKVESDGDLIDGSITGIIPYIYDFPLGVLTTNDYVEIDGSIVVEQPSDVNINESNGSTVIVSNSDGIGMINSDKKLNGRLLIVSEYIYEWDSSGVKTEKDYTEITGELNVDPKCQYPEVPEINSSFYISKFFAFENNYYDDSDPKNVIYTEDTSKCYYVDRIDVQTDASGNPITYASSESTGDLITGRVDSLIKFDHDKDNERVDIDIDLTVSHPINHNGDGTEITNYQWPEISGSLLNVTNYITTLIINPDGSVTEDTNEDRYAEIAGTELKALYAVGNGVVNRRIEINGSIYVAHNYIETVNVIDPTDHTQNEIIENPYTEINGSGVELIFRVDHGNDDERIEINGKVDAQYKFYDKNSDIDSSIDIAQPINVGTDGIEITNYKWPEINGKLLMVEESVGYIEGYAIIMDMPLTYVDGSIDIAQPINHDIDGTEITNYQWPEIDGSVFVAYEYITTIKIDSAGNRVADTDEDRYAEINIEVHPVVPVFYTRYIDASSTLIDTSTVYEDIPNTDHTEYDDSMEISGEVTIIGIVGKEYSHLIDGTPFPSYGYYMFASSKVDEYTGEKLYSSLWEEYLYNSPDLIIDFTPSDMEIDCSAIIAQLIVNDNMFINGNMLNVEQPAMVTHHFDTNGIEIAITMTYEEIANAVKTTTDSNVEINGEVTIVLIASKSYVFIM